MVRGVLLFSLGALIGAGVVALSRTPGAGSAPLQTQRESVEIVQSLRMAQERIAELEADIKRLKVAHANGEILTPSSAPVRHEANNGASRDEDEGHQRNAVRWRVSAIEKFVPLTEDQRNRLTEKFTADADSARAGDTPNSESLDDILGVESAQFYRQQVQAAFARAHDQEIEREVVWLSRQLSLTAEQETAVRQAMTRIEQQLQSGKPPHGAGSSDPQHRVQAMIEESKARRELTNAEFSKVLTPEQYQAYLRSEAESVDSDVEIFHDPGADQP